MAEEPEVVDALDQLAMSLNWEANQHGGEFADEYKRRVLEAAIRFVVDKKPRTLPGTVDLCSY